MSYLDADNMDGFGAISLVFFGSDLYYDILRKPHLCYTILNVAAFCPQKLI